MRFLKWLAVVATAGMFLVLVMGATVTNTGSAEGCGKSWPLCNGRFVPEFAAAAMIEYSHRAVTGVEGILVAALTIGAWRVLRRREERIVITLMAVTLILQAGMGAWAVMSPQTPAIMATHFGISLVCLASTFLVAAYIFEADHPRDLRQHAPPPMFTRAVWGITLYTLVAVYIGAYVRHTNAQLACIDWPLCNGEIFPGFAGPVGVVFAHRVTALVLAVGIVWLALMARRFADARPDLYRATLVGVGLVVAQSLAGAVIVFTRMNLFSALLHAALVSLLFAVLGYLCVRVRSRAAEPRAADHPLPTTITPRPAS